MNIYSKTQLKELRHVMRRPHGAVSTFLPTEGQASLIRLAVEKHYSTKTVGTRLYVDTGIEVWKNKNINDTWAPVLVKNREGNWLFMTHHLFDNSKAVLNRARSDVYEENPPGHIIYKDEFGDELDLKNCIRDDLGELIGGTWGPKRARKLK